RIPLGLEGHPEASAEQVEVVDVERSEIDLQRAENLGQRQTEQFRFVAVEVIIVLRRRGTERREQALAVDLGLRSGVGNQCLGRVIQCLASLTAEILDFELEPAKRADTGD